MAINTQRTFRPSSRYEFDRDLNEGIGWTQVDTEQDASYFGNWTNPTERSWFSYTEGDICIVTCDTDEDYIAYVNETMNWYLLRENRRPFFDFLSPAIKAEFERLGLQEWFYQKKESGA